MSDRAKKYGIEIALTLGALAGVLCVLTAVVGVAFNLSPLVFRSGSMEPTIGVGDVAIARSVPASDISVGDIVSVTRADGTRITHRVASIDSRVGNSTTMTLRGDANIVADAAPYTVTSVDRVLFDVPKLGYVLSWFTNPYAWAIAALATLGLLFAAFRPDKRFRPAPRGRHAATAQARPRATALTMQVVAVAVVVAAAVTGYARTSGTLAALTDSATATGTVTSGRPEAPTSLTCTTTGGSARLSFPNPVSHQGYSYQLVVTPTFLGTGSTTVQPASTTDPYVINVNRSFMTGALGLALLGTYTVDIRSQVGSFLSSGKVSITVTLFIGSVSCGSSTGTASQSLAAARSAPAPTSTTSSAAPTSTTSSTSAAPTSSSTSSVAPTSTPTTEAPAPSPSSTTAAPAPAAVADSTSPSGTYVASGTDGAVVIRDKASGAEQYRLAVTASKLDWVDDSTLRITAADGTVTTVTRTDGTWSAAGATATASAAG